MSEPSLAERTARLSSGSDIEAGGVSPRQNHSINSTGSLHQTSGKLTLPGGRRPSSDAVL